MKLWFQKKKQRYFKSNTKKFQLSTDLHLTSQQMTSFGAKTFAKFHLTHQIRSHCLLCVWVIVFDIHFFGRKINCLIIFDMMDLIWFQFFVPDS